MKTHPARATKAILTQLALRERGLLTRSEAAKLTLWRGPGGLKIKGPPALIAKLLERLKKA